MGGVRPSQDLSLLTQRKKKGGEISNMSVANLAIEKIGSPNSYVIDNGTFWFTKILVYRMSIAE